MKFFVAIAATIIASSASAAAPAGASPAATLTKALTCEIGVGKEQSVVKALKALGARRGKLEGDYVLDKPVTAFGLPVTHVTVTPGDGESPETYFANFPGGDIKQVAAAAQLKPLAGGYARDTKKGALSADIRDGNVVALSCTPL